MSIYINSDPIFVTEIRGEYIEEVLNDVLNWMNTRCDLNVKNQIIERKNSFYFLDMNIHNDTEFGWCVSIYHGEI